MPSNIGIARCTLAIGHWQYYVGTLVAMQPTVLMKQAFSRTGYAIEGVPAKIQSRRIILSDNKISRVYTHRTVNLDINGDHVVPTVRRHKRSCCRLVQANSRSIGGPWQTNCQYSNDDQQKFMSTYTWSVPNFCSSSSSQPHPQLPLHQTPSTA
jgi:hypothetical protein